MDDNKQRRRIIDRAKKRVEEMESSVFKRVKEMQAPLIDSAKPHFDESELSHLRCLVRLAVEFHHYLEHGSVAIATALLDAPLGQYVTDAQAARADPFNKYDLEFVCGSVRSGVDSFCIINGSFRLLDTATGSTIEWGMTSSKESFKTRFVSMFEEFVEEVDFAKKVRLLLDLFKLQIVFTGISMPLS